MSPSLTSEVVDYLLRVDPPPADVERKDVEHIIDGIAVMLAGSRTECASFVIDEDRIEKVLDAIRGIEGIPNIAELTSLLAKN